MFSNELICNIIEYINKNINKEITADELSSLFFFDKTYIMKRFKRETDLTIHEYINIMRIYNSLIYYSDDNHILSVAFKNGFNSLEYYSEIFKKIIGVSPKTYKKYVSYKYISREDEKKILKNIALIQKKKDDINIYLSRRKPKTRILEIKRPF